MLQAIEFRRSLPLLALFDAAIMFDAIIEIL